jgi:hypothetical protein
MWEDNHMLLSYSIINPLTLVEVERHLSHTGEVLVGENETVEPYQVVAEAQEMPEFRIVNVARVLNLPPKRVKKMLRVSVGDTVEENQRLASRGGLGGHVCRAPFAGTITGYGRGRLLLEAQPAKTQLQALVPGTVVRVWSGEGVMIQTHGALIQAAWGNDRETYGVLSLVVRAPHHPLRARRLDASAQGSIVVGGLSLDDEVLDQAIDMQVRGIIVGSISPDMLPRLREIEIPVLATEGIGDIPMSEAAFDLLRSLDGREAALSALTPDWQTDQRPYITIPMPAKSGTSVDPQAPLDIGDRVRALRNPYSGMTGEITDLPSGLIRVETGARLPGAYVDFGEDEPAFVPFANLERIL